MGTDRCPNDCECLHYALPGPVFPQVEKCSARLLFLFLKTKVVYALLVVSLLMQKGTKPMISQV